MDGTKNACIERRYRRPVNREAARFMSQFNYIQRCILS
jgi:hypothetical protein